MMLFGTSGGLDLPGEGGRDLAKGRSIRLQGPSMMAKEMVEGWVLGGVL